MQPIYAELWFCEVRAAQAVREEKQTRAENAGRDWAALTDDAKLSRHTQDEKTSAQSRELRQMASAFLWREFKHAGVSGKAWPHTEAERRAFVKHLSSKPAPMDRADFVAVFLRDNPHNFATDVYARAIRAALEFWARYSRGAPLFVVDPTWRQ